MPLHSTRFDVRRYGRDVERHSHDHHQIVLPMQGVLDMEIGGAGGAAIDGETDFRHAARHRERHDEKRQRTGDETRGHACHDASPGI